MLLQYPSVDHDLHTIRYGRAVADSLEHEGVLLLCKGQHPPRYEAAVLPRHTWRPCHGICLSPARLRKRRQFRSVSLRQIMPRRSAPLRTLVSMALSACSAQVCIACLQQSNAATAGLARAIPLFCGDGSWQGPKSELPWQPHGSGSLALTPAVSSVRQSNAVTAGLAALFKSFAEAKVDEESRAAGGMPRHVVAPTALREALAALNAEAFNIGALPRRSACRASLALMHVCRAHRTAPLSLMGAGGVRDVADMLGTIYDGTHTILMVTNY